MFVLEYMGGGGAHPRSRGEHEGQGRAGRGERGSSPLARGTLFFRRVDNLVSGLIPARAGNTMRRCLRFPIRRAHPRSRGEHGATFAAFRDPSGSSPLARGTRWDDAPLETFTGLIPARAGNTVYASWVPRKFRAHPRSRGEHGAQAARAAGEVGSSPLARGTHLLTWDFTPYISKIESLWSQSLTPEYTISSHY